MVLRRVVVLGLVLVLVLLAGVRGLLRDLLFEKVDGRLRVSGAGGRDCKVVVPAGEVMDDPSAENAREETVRLLVEAEVNPTVDVFEKSASDRSPLDSEAEE